MYICIYSVDHDHCGGWTSVYVLSLGRNQFCELRVLAELPGPVSADPHCERISGFEIMILELNHGSR